MTHSQTLKLSCALLETKTLISFHSRGGKSSVEHGTLLNWTSVDAVQLLPYRANSKRTPGRDVPHVRLSKRARDRSRGNSAGHE